MDKDSTAAPRRHRPGPGAPPTGPPGSLKSASEMGELQRSRSVGGLHQKGDPPSRLARPGKEQESEDRGKDLRNDSEDASCPVSVEETKQDKDKLGQSGLDSGQAELEGNRSSDPNAREESGEGLDRRSLGTQELKAQGSLLEKEKLPVFVEIDLRDCAEEVVPCAVREDKQPQTDVGDLSEDEARTSWVCCIPYTSKKRSRDSV
ncbi:uncharacterized protein C13orf46 homolog [Erinaceus europaeus]|uniref:Uncharacterized protein C13orf46 homolog n=1 Tax=Erinaceus europaeus TaxID=9365 RepID=A0ABM3WT14_ERIEU|nr:uncharacterized protein C13orf46 homolog [Erinaceus europaeus]